MVFSATRPLLVALEDAVSGEIIFLESISAIRKIEGSESEISAINENDGPESDAGTKLADNESHRGNVHCDTESQDDLSRSCSRCKQSFGNSTTIIPIRIRSKHVLSEVYCQDCFAATPLTALEREKHFYREQAMEENQS